MTRRGLEFREIEFGSPEYGVELEMRHRILREPLGVEWTEEERGWEPKERHFGMLEEETVVACVLVRELGDGYVKLRQMAVEPERQGSGVGRELLERVEELLWKDGVKQIELNARDVAVGFYAKQGYEKVGEEFVEVGIPHRKMRKGLLGD